MTWVPPTPAGSYTPASWNPEFVRSCAARVSASSFISGFVPKCRQPVGQALIQAGSSPTDTRSLHSVHLKTFRDGGSNFGILNGQPVMQYPQPMQFASWKSTMPLAYCTMAASAGQANCIGCGYCMTGCPFNIPKFDPPS